MLNSIYSYIVVIITTIITLSIMKPLPVSLFYETLVLDAKELRYIAIGLPVLHPYYSTPAVSRLTTTTTTTMTIIIIVTEYNIS